MKKRYLKALASAGLLCASLLAFSQEYEMRIPASAVDSGGRAVGVLTPLPDNICTSTNGLCATDLYIQEAVKESSAQSRSWTSYFIGKKTTHEPKPGGYIYSFSLEFMSDGSMKIVNPYNLYQNYPHLINTPAPFYFSGGGGVFIIPTPAGSLPGMIQGLGLFDGSGRTCDFTISPVYNNTDARDGLPPYNFKITRSDCISPTPAQGG